MVNIRARTESPVQCCCGKPAIRRTLDVGGYHTSYDTHSTCLADDMHLAALKRMKAFFTKAFALRDKLNALPPEKKRLEVGDIVNFDVGSIHPDACSHRNELIIEINVRAFGKEIAVILPSRSIAGVKIAGVVKEARAAALGAARAREKAFLDGR